MILHSVILKLKCPAGSVQEKAFLAAAKQLASIPGVDNLQVLRQTSAKNNFDFGICMGFANQQIYDAYSSHPDHQAFIEQYWLKDVDGFLEIDYAPLV
jgi:Stress responsive A/B Barrel Domain